MSHKNKPILTEYKKSNSEWSVIKLGQADTETPTVEQDALALHIPAEKKSVRNQVFQVLQSRSNSMLLS